MQPMTIRLPDETYEYYRDRAFKERTSIAFLIQTALDALQTAIPDDHVKVNQEIIDALPDNRYYREIRSIWKNHDESTHVQYFVPANYLTHKVTLR